VCDAKVANVFADDAGHGHAQRSGEILHRHFSLTLRGIQQVDDFLCECCAATCPVEINGHIFFHRHMSKISDI